LTTEKLVSKPVPHPVRTTTTPVITATLGARRIQASKRKYFFIAENS
jgi:hypothetical protein